MILYIALKHTHMTCVALSFGLFMLRGILLFSDPDYLKRKWLRIVPHVIDTLLLVSAIGLMFTIHQYPFVNSWLTAKLAGLILYIVLGSVALKYGKTMQMRATALILALISFTYIVSVALTHSATLGF